MDYSTMIEIAAVVLGIAAVVFGSKWLQVVRILKAVTAGVEKYAEGESYQSNKDVKTAVKGEATAAGVERTLNGFVKRWFSNK